MDRKMVLMMMIKRKMTPLDSLLNRKNSKMFYLKVVTISSQILIKTKECKMICLEGIEGVGAGEARAGAWSDGLRGPGQRLGAARRPRPCAGGLEGPRA